MPDPYTTKCRYCPKKVVPGRTMCGRHLEARRKVSQRYRDRKVQAGCCSVCGRTPLATKLYCQSCRILYRKVYRPKPCTLCLVEGHTRRDHPTLKLCWHCSSTTMLGSNLCEQHHQERAETRRQQSKAVRQEWQRQGRCLVCGEPATTKTRCERHRNYAAEWERLYRVR